MEHSLSKITKAVLTGIILSLYLLSNSAMAAVVEEEGSSYSDNSCTSGDCSTAPDAPEADPEPEFDPEIPEFDDSNLEMDSVDTDFDDLPNESEPNLQEITCEQRKEARENGGGKYDQFEVKTFLSVLDCDENAEGTQQQSYFDSDQPLIAFILQVIEFLTKVAGSIAFLIIVAAGGMMITGMEEYINKAKEMIQAAVIGLVFTFSAYIIVIFVQSLFF